GQAELGRRWAEDAGLEHAAALDRGAPAALSARGATATAPRIPAIVTTHPVRTLGRLDDLRRTLAPPRRHSRLPEILRQPLQIDVVVSGDDPILHRLVLRLLVEEAPALVGELVQKRRGPPEITARLLLESQQPIADRLEADLVGPEHRAATVDGPAIAARPDDGDVARADGLAFLEDLGALVDHRVEQSLADLVVGDRATRHAGFLRDFQDDALDLGIGPGRAIATFVLVEA